jgi:peptide/nickel transport system ATP-binding protein
LKTDDILLHAQNLKKHFAPRQGLLERAQTTLSEWKATKTPLKTLWERNSQPVRAVDGVSLSLGPSEVVGLVGESGSGKTTLGRLLARLTPPTAGQVTFDGQEITALSRAEMRRLRGSIRMMFQKPAAVLNPDLTIRQILTEAIEMHPDEKIPDREQKLRQLREMVNLPVENLQKYPGDLSGGLLRRVAIARTLVGRPSLIIADEPVAGLDVSIQAQIINLMRDIHNEHGVAYLLISHNLQVVRYLSQRILVMYHGRIVEEGTVDEISSQNARHPYTIELLKSANYDLAEIQDTESTAPQNGEIRGCPYRFDGCPLYESGGYDQKRCEEERPELRPLGNLDARHRVACHYCVR